MLWIYAYDKMGNLCTGIGGNRKRGDKAAKYLPSPDGVVHISAPDSQGEDPPTRSDTGNNAASGSSSPHSRPLPSVPSVVSSKKRVRALYQFDAINDDDLAFKKGDIMELDESTLETDDWWLAIHTKTKERGYIPSNYVIMDDMSPRAQDWWFDFGRKESDKQLLLPGHPKGTFLVREATDKTSYVLSIRDSDPTNLEPTIKHYRIRKMDDKRGFYISAKKTFGSLIDVIDHYCEDTDGLCCRLTHPCPRVKPVVPFRELEINRDLVKLTTRLGAGCFGEVWKGTLRKVVDVAVKTLKVGTMSSEAFLNEAKIMHKLTHPQLVQLMAVVSVSEPFYIITELMVNGALLDFLRSERGKMQAFRTLIEMNSQIADGMSYLETKNFVHRDLRAANILVGGNLEVKVADFGLARMLKKDDPDYHAGENTKFPVKWTAPEAAFGDKTFSVKSDVWSFGVLMYEIITYGKSPYPGMSGYEALLMVEKGDRMTKPTNGPIEVPDSYFGIMLKCWNKIPENRPTFESLHHFFDDYFINVEPNYKDMGEI